MKIIWTELAIEQLEEYADYIALDKPSAALSWAKKIQKSVRKLKDFSESGRKVSEINRSNIREIIEGNYRIIYRIEEKSITILTIRNSRQLLADDDVFEAN